MCLDEYVSAKIDELCRTNQMSRYRLSALTGLSQSVLSDIINQRSIPTLITLEKICKAFNIGLSQFFESDNPTEGVIATEEQREVLNLYKRLNLDEKRFIKICMRGLGSERDRE